MERASLAAELSARRFGLVAELEAGGGWGGPADDVRGGLEVVVDDFAAAVALGSAGLLDRSFSWWKIRVRSLGGDPDVVEQLPRRFAAAMAELSPGCLQPDVLTLLEHAAAYVRHAPDVARTGAALHRVLMVVYFLRCQVVHGGATMGSGVNRVTVDPAARLLRGLAGQIIAVCMERGLEMAWGELCYPPVRSHDGA